MLTVIITAIGVISGLIALLVFLTGKSSIHHFLPSGKRQPLSLSKPQLEELPLSSDKERFIVKENTLFLKCESLEIAALTHLDKLKDYRILFSTDNSKFLIAYKRSFDDQFTHIVVANSDGANRKEHAYHSGFIDARWLSNDSYLIFLELKRDYDGKISDGLLNKYPRLWRHLDPKTLGRYSWDVLIKPGNYLVQLSAKNEISRVEHY